MISSTAADETHLHQFERLIAAHAGFQLRPREREALRGALARRMALLQLQRTDEYYALLQSGRQDAHIEWEQLVACLTNNESYFFRDKGQMALLRERILPEMIARNEKHRTLRIWSAGCSTGEEPYSLAMLVDELLPGGPSSSGAKWEILILGTDIDQQALQQAREGCYSSWSFRNVEPALKARFFCPSGDRWQVSDSSRALVTFGQCNLVGDHFPSRVLGIHEMDLILCRNVFIYLEHKAVATVLHKLAQTLRDGGYLMTGHNETHGHLVEPLQARTFPESVVYQRVGTATQTIRPTGSNHHLGQPVSSRPSSVGRRTVTASKAPLAEASKNERVEAEVPYRANDASATALIRQPAPEAPSDNELLRLAHAQANEGRYAEAISSCERLISSHPLGAEPYEVLASIAQEQKRYEEAKLLLKKALYLAPASPTAYLELGALYNSEGDTARARTMHAAALDLLQQMPPDAAVGAAGNSSAQGWILHLRQLLEGDE